ncbi:MAG TPA: hypothetical protein VKP08_14425, partial [Anaerolineales bacterium]|nr:hypothetical protein [Anaerolineales bacterium]
MIETTKLKNSMWTRVSKNQKLANLGKLLYKYRWLYVMMLPGIVYFLVFRYVPLLNAQIAFKQFKPLLGVWGSPWVGFKNFVSF